MEAGKTKLALKKMKIRLCCVSVYIKTKVGGFCRVLLLILMQIVK